MKYSIIVKESRAENQHSVLLLPHSKIAWLVSDLPPYQSGSSLEKRMNGRVIIVTHEDGREEEFPSIMKTVVTLNISATTINLRLRSGEPYLWNGEKIKFRYK